MHQRQATNELLRKRKRTSQSICFPSSEISEVSLFVEIEKQSGDKPISICQYKL